MVYATYQYYKTEYYGETIPEKAFPRMIAKASQYIDNFTFGRITEGDVETFPSISACECEMAEIICKAQTNNMSGKEIKSESTDGYSVTYVTERVDGETEESAMRRKLYALAEVYLMNTGLLYLGC